MKKRLFKALRYPKTVWLPKSEHNFLTFIGGAFILAMFATPYPHIATKPPLAMGSPSMEKTNDQLVTKNREKFYQIVVFQNS